MTDITQTCQLITWDIVKARIANFPSHTTKLKSYKRSLLRIAGAAESNGLDPRPMMNATPSNLVRMIPEANRMIELCQMVDLQDLLWNAMQMPYQEFVLLMGKRRKWLTVKRFEFKGEVKYFIGLTAPEFDWLKRMARFFVYFHVKDEPQM